MNKKFAPIIGLIIVTIIWGGGFVASDLALKGFLPTQIMTIRFLIGAIFMFILAFKNLKKIKKEEIIYGFLMGVSLFSGFMLQIVGLMYTTASKNAFLTGTNVVIVPFITFLILRKKIGIKSILGAILAIVGVGLLSLNEKMSMGYGDILTLIAAACFSFQIFFTSRAVLKCNGNNINFIQMLVAFILSFIACAIKGDFDFTTNFDGLSFSMVLYLGILSTSVCYLIQTLCQKYVEETKVAVILSMESVFGALFSMMILKEHLTLKMIIGCAVILTGVIISTKGESGEKSEKNLSTCK